MFKPRGKKKEDEAWNPKARVRVQGPRPERPMRQGVRRQAVEKGLEQAAARRQNLPVSVVVQDFLSEINRSGAFFLTLRRHIREGIIHTLW